MTTYEIESFFDPSENVGDQTKAEVKAAQWLNEVARRNGRVISITTTPSAAMKNSTGTLTTIKSRIVIVVAYN